MRENSTAGVGVAPGEPRKGFDQWTRDAGDACHFMHRFLMNPGQIGAIAPSSDFLAAAMVEGVIPRREEGVLELGPGTGSFTKALRTVLPDPKAYVGIECEAKFVQMLGTKYPEMKFVEGRAEHGHQICQDNLPYPVKLVISGLPFASLSLEAREAVVSSLAKLLPTGATFRTFQYVHAFGLPTAVNFRRMMRRDFGEYRERRIVFRNLPPAYVLTWQRH